MKAWCSATARNTATILDWPISLMTLIDALNATYNVRYLAHEIENKLIGHVFFSVVNVARLFFNSYMSKFL